MFRVRVLAFGLLGTVAFAAIGAGGLAARLVPGGVVFGTALAVTAFSALVGGLAAGPLLYRLRGAGRFTAVIGPCPAERPFDDGPEGTG